MYFIYVPCILYSLFSRPTKTLYIYAYINNVVMPYALIHVSMHPHNIKAVLFFSFAVFKISLDFIYNFKNFEG